MIGYVTVGTNKFSEAVKFYDALFETLGFGRMISEETFVAWGTFDGQTPGFGITHPHNKEPATVGNGVMVALVAPDTATVDKVHAKALELGGTNEGDAGPRDMPGFYAGYFRDLDGNKFNIFHHDMSQMTG